MIYVPTDPEGIAAVSRWVGARVVGDFERCTAMAVLRGGEMVAGFVFHDYRHPSIHVSMAADSPRWASKEVIDFVVQYVFGKLNCKVLVATINKNNKRCRRMVDGIGFQYQGKVPDGAPDGDVCIYTLHVSQMSEWKYGKEHPSSAQAA